ncbi:efflux RND transporter periplasmic adaptor subunit [Butyrivibrio fibrisolvens]|uniref:efflux RND transporter periplasmic adaptor subunit n=1 Tax=Pseudobutyrivibrio ruminis TaxID=46206 RepID=UPI000423CDD0|nr:efflux RND transporter periplasmic adaptor subunit [Pseudobutyrivibrio ruminis]MDC7278537.1 efflux RND transporter periplasmic adaptor subunit [Butyrivibrio fibrisolvens]
MKLKEVLNKIKFWEGKDLDLDDEIDEKLDEVEGELSKKDKKFFKKLNKKVVAAMVIAAILISSIAGVASFKKASAKTNEEDMTITIPVAKQDIQKTLAATGTIISAEESTEFATTGGSYPVEEVYVKVGDVVKKGDPLYKLDMTSMEQQLSYQQQALNIQNQQNELAAQTAEAALKNAQDTGAVSINDANRSLAEAQQNQSIANRNRKSADDALGDARRAEDNAYRAFNSAKEALSRVESNPDSTQEEKDTAQAKVNNAKSDYENAVSNRKTAETNLASAKDAVDTANRSLDGASQAAGKAQTDANASVITQAQSVKSGELTAKASTISNQQEIAKSKEELGKATVFASQDGTVTNVNIKVGQTYSGTDAIVIDNVTSLKATADIDEAQIPNIELGQKVQIKTDATGDDVLEGTVTFVSPTATKNSTKSTDSDSTTASVSKSRATYRVDVTLNGTNERLRLGMTAKMTFIIANAKNALAVPSADIQTDFDGSKYVVVQKKDGTTENVTVTTGISDDFYTEIKDGKLKEGAEIVENSSEGGIDATLDDMGADGGIYFE